MKKYPKFDSRSLGVDTATKIAESQFDLGGKSKKDMIITLTGKYNTDQRKRAYNRLDELSKLIVSSFIKSDSLSSAQTDFDYYMECLKRAKASVNDSKFD